MFADDKPIEKSEDDRLSRLNFSNRLSKSIIEWKNPESLVIALYGKWGSGKSSVINLARTEIQKSQNEDKPTIIEFNPWFFSGDDKLIEHYFSEIANELEIQNATERDAEIASKLRLYVKLFGLVPDSHVLKTLFDKVVLGIAIFSITSGQILQWLHLGSDTVKIFFFVVSFVSLLFTMVGSFTEKLADYFEQRASGKQKSVLALKKEIKNALLKRKRKILLILDDLDRLNSDETRAIFRLVKANTDFPNVVYLLSFDRDVVQATLEQQPGISGQDYIEKIVQVSFDIPVAKQEKIQKILFSELDRVLGILPKSYETRFDQIYWGNVYHSGLKNFFRSIRDVKRFVSSLEFSISLMFKGKSMEVNSIDFIAIEGIRVFVPSFYSFMRTRSDLFTSTKKEDYEPRNRTRVKEIDEEINKAPEYLRDDLKNILRRLFPQLDGVYDVGYSTHGSDWLPIWSRELRVCSPKHFDTYFTLIPGGDETELSQFQVDSLLEKLSSESEFEESLRVLLSEGKIVKMLERFEDYTGDETRVPIAANENIVQGLFNISDDLPINRTALFDLSADIRMARVIYQLLRRVPDKGANFLLYKNAIEASKGLFGPVYCVSLESRRDGQRDEKSVLATDEELSELQQACVAKIVAFQTSGILSSNPNLLTILYRWRDWSADGAWKKFAAEITIEDAGLVLFLKNFVYESSSQAMGDYVSRKRQHFNFNSLKNFVSADAIKKRLEIIKAEKPVFYKENQELIEMFLQDFDKPADPLDA